MWIWYSLPAIQPFVHFHRCALRNIIVCMRVYLFVFMFVYELIEIDSLLFCFVLFLVCCFVVFLLIIKHHKFLIELRNIHTGASKLDSIHIHWFALFPSGFRSFGCNLIGSLLFELIKKRASLTLCERIAHAVCQMRTLQTFLIHQNNSCFSCSAILYPKMYWTGKRLKMCKKRFECDELTRQKRIGLKLRNRFYVFFTFWMAIFRLSG